MNTLQRTRQIPVIGHYDVVVCGGGPSGFVAAVAAARCGAQVALIERRYPPSEKAADGLGRLSYKRIMFLEHKFTGLFSQPRQTVDKVFKKA